MTDILFLLSPDRLVRGINNTASKILGYTEKELQDKDISMIFSKTNFENKVFIEDKFPMLFKDGKISDEESIFKTKEGKDIPVSISASLIKSKQEDIRGVVCIARDITDRKYAEEEIKKYHQKVVRATSDVEEKNARLEATLLAIGEGLIITDKEGNIIRVNKIFEKLLGWLPHEVMGKKFYNIVPLVDKNGNVISKKKRMSPLLLFPGKKIKSDQKSMIITTKGHLFIAKDRKRKIPIFLTSTPIIHRWEIIGLIEAFHPVSEK
jgi:PAS domain S-box-containing protein